MKNKVTMQSIADEFGVTKVTVSKAINNQPGISEDLRGKILRRAEELGYLKTGLKYSEVKKFAFLAPNRFFFENENFYKQIYFYLLKQCNLQNIDLIISILSSEDEENCILPYTIAQNAFDGIFIAGETTNDYFDFICKCKLPLVAIDFYKAKMDIDCVVVDNYFASYCAANYLIAKGHKKIGFIGNSGTTSSVLDRYYGYLKALSQSKLESNIKWYLQNKDSNGLNCSYILPDDLPTAFICHCDEAAYDLSNLLIKNGIKVPDDISIISFDNTKYSINAAPAITSTEINKEIIASKVFNLMIKRIQNPARPAQRVILETRIIERDSVKEIG